MMNPFSSRCCQHNHTSGWVYYAENLWMATPDNGLAAVFYSDSEVKAKVADGADVAIQQQTHYPFDERVSMQLKLTKTVSFPLYVRIPAWCEKPTIKINDQTVAVAAVAGHYLKIVNTWKNNDRLVLEFPMTLRTKTWEKNKNSVSVSYGPLTYSLKISEKYIRFDSKATAQYDSKWQENTDPSKWPSFEILPDAPWNYGLVDNFKALDKNFTIVKKPWPTDNYPFTLAAGPIELKTKGRKISDWIIDQYGLCAELPQSPVTTNNPIEDITLVPMGAARLRISSFPVVK
jgi:hypothetical protein